MNEILDMVRSTLDRVYAEHFYLIENQVSERSIVFWFGVYFYEILHGTGYSEFNLDTEYNRNISETKRTKQFPRGTYPDLILHKRGSNSSNLLIIEFKPWWNVKTKDDIRKLIDFTDPNGDYNYNLGLSILIGYEAPSGKIVQNGEVAGEF